MNDPLLRQQHKVLLSRRMPESFNITTQGKSIGANRERRDHHIS
jgi:hypothetical protein